MKTSRVLPQAQASSNILKDFEAYSAHCLKIKTKDQRLIPLVFNDAQKLMWAAIKEQMNVRRPVRLVCLKGRQLGCSTFSQAFVFWRTVTNPNTHTLVVAHDIESTSNIFQIATTMYENLPDEFRPMRRRSNKKELLFENPDAEERFKFPGLRSRIEVRTAGNKESGRGSFYHNLHLSEVSSYPDPELLAMSLFPTVPPLPTSAIIVESTAKGLGSWWHDFYIRSKNGETGFKAIFLPWFLEPSYRLPLKETKEWMAERPLDEYERGLKKHFGVTNAQLAFRRMILAQQGEAYVLQEFPSTDDECWLGAGYPVFDRMQIRDLIDKARKVQPVFVGDVNLEHGALVPHPNGSLRIWEMPKPDHTYVVGVDSSYGTKGGSQTAIVVLTRGTTQRHVATWLGTITPLDTVPIIEYLATMYGTALVSVEINGAGLAIQESLSRSWPYCVAPDARILTADLRWVRADSIKPGDVLVGIDEYGSPKPPGHRYIRKSQVEDVGVYDAPRVLVKTRRGQIVTSIDHKFLVYGAERVQASRTRYYRAGWIEAQNLKPGDLVSYLVEPWDSPRTWEAGAIYGYYQGEGSLRLSKSKNGLAVSFSQKRGPIFKEVQSFLSDFGIHAKDRTASTQVDGIRSLLIEGIGQSLKFLGMFRPSRLLASLERWWGHGTIPRNHPSYWDEVVSVEPVGHGPVVAISTTTRTYIAEGYVAHNCYRWRYLDNYYHKPTDKAGWLTTPTSKPILIGHMSYMLAHNAIQTWDEELLDEMFNYIYIDNERTVAAAGPGSSDDVLMATMIASLTDWLDGGYSRHAVQMPEVRSTPVTYNPVYVDTMDDVVWGGGAML